MRNFLTVVFVMLIAISANAYASGSASADIEYWAGSGSNSAVCVIDFGAHSYAFGYKWDTGTYKGFDMIQAIDAAGAVNLDIKDFGYGAFVNGISYNEDSCIGYGGGDNWWHYWTSENGASWAMASTGASGRTITDGCWDGWCYGSAGAPDVPSVPEPSSMTAVFSMIGLAASTRLLRRRGK
ncbi:MAG: hypothetical protein ABFD83_02565 [Armatimonadota bacterium]